MASSNRHWPSMFKSKPHQWQHEVNSSLISNGCHRSSSSSYSSEERTPEPKPRWNPKPEQIRILESIFDSGMVNPPREEIRKIRAELQKYGQVGDANVFYWFQNRKSRSKHKLRNLNNSSKQQQQQQQRHQTPPATTTTVAVAPSSSSSSSSSENKSSPRNGFSKSCTSNVFTLGPSNMDVSNFSLSPPPPPYFPITQEAGILTEPFSFQVNNGFLLPEGFVHYGGGQPVVVGPCETNFMLSEMMNHTDHHGGATSKKVKTTATDINTSTTAAAAAAATSATYSSVVPSSSSSSCASVSPPTVTVPFLSSITTTHHHHHQLHARTTANVFINDVAFEVVADEPFNVRATFGDEAVLVNGSGQGVLTDEWGVTLHPLNPGSFYYLIWLALYIYFGKHKLQPDIVICEPLLLPLCTHLDPYSLECVNQK